MATTASGAGADAVATFVERMAGALATWGFPRTPARVMIMLMAAPPGGLTTGEICEGLGISPAAVSTAMTYLQHMGLIERRTTRGSRRLSYVLPNDTWYVASMTKSDALNHLAGLADEGAAGLVDVNPHAAARVAEMADFFRFTADEMDGLLERWHAHRRTNPSRYIRPG